MKAKFYWHYYHEGLLVYAKWVDTLKFRRWEIKKFKDHKQIRLKLLKEVKGKLPQDIIDFCKQNSGAYHSLNELVRKSEVVKRLHKKECPNCPYDWEKGEIIFDKT